MLRVYEFVKGVCRDVDDDGDAEASGGGGGCAPTHAGKVACMAVSRALTDAVQYVSNAEGLARRLRRRWRLDSRGRAQSAQVSSRSHGRSCRGPRPSA